MNPAHWQNQLVTPLISRPDNEGISIKQASAVRTTWATVTTVFEVYMKREVWLTRTHTYDLLAIQSALGKQLGEIYFPRSQEEEIHRDKYSVTSPSQLTGTVKLLIR